jgi:hypothetical protein
MKRGGIVPEGYWTLVQGFAFCLETKTFGGRTERYIVVGLDAGRGKPLREHERAWLGRLRSEGVYGGRSKPRPSKNGSLICLVRCSFYAVGLSGTGWVARKSFWKRVA